jgi:DivIVA domain-containing protein
MTTELSSGVVAADHVVLTQFGPTHLRRGYDQIEVDDYLDEVALALRAWEAGETPEHPLTSTDLLSKEFRTRKWIEGYRMDEVDHFIERVAATLYRYETNSRN